EAYPWRTPIPGTRRRSARVRIVTRTGVAPEHTTVSGKTPALHPADVAMDATTKVAARRWAFRVRPPGAVSWRARSPAAFQRGAARARAVPAGRDDRWLHLLRRTRDRPGAAVP